MIRNVDVHKVSPVSNSVIYFLMFPFFSLSLSFLSTVSTRFIKINWTMNPLVNTELNLVSPLQVQGIKKDYNDKNQMKTDLVTVEEKQY